MISLTPLNSRISYDSINTVIVLALSTHWPLQIFHGQGKYLWRFAQIWYWNCQLALLFHKFLTLQNVYHISLKDLDCCPFIHHCYILGYKFSSYFENLPSWGIHYLSRNCFGQTIAFSYKKCVNIRINYILQVTAASIH